MIDRKLAIKLAKYDTIFCYEGLSPWIKNQKALALQRSYFSDLEWFYNECIKECENKN